MRTVEVAVQTVRPAHWRSTCRVWVMGVVEDTPDSASSFGKSSGTSGRSEETVIRVCVVKGTIWMGLEKNALDRGRREEVCELQPKCSPEYTL